MSGGTADWNELKISIDKLNKNVISLNDSTTKYSKWLCHLTWILVGLTIMMIILMLWYK